MTGMRGWLLVPAAILAFSCGDVAAQIGRTDGPEGSEISHGGYHWRERGRLYVEGMFGSATVDIDARNARQDNSRTDLLAGVSAGYLLEDWLGFQVGYGQIGGARKTDLFSVGIRNHLKYEPFNYYLGLDAELYAPAGSDAKFGIVPGAGAEVVLGQHLRFGLRYQHDFIFADDNISINRFSASVQVLF